MTDRPALHWTPRPRPQAAPLAGRSVRLEPLAAVHAAPLHAAFDGHPGLWRWMAYGPFDAAGYAAFVADQAGREDPLFFAIAPQDGGPSGVAALLRIDPAHGVAEVGHIVLSPALQRTPAATEAIALLAGRVFGLGYRRFEWKCDAANEPSRKAALRLGFAYEGTFRNHMVIRDRNRDTAWFAMTDGDWHGGLAAAFAAWLDPANFDAAGRQRTRLSALTAAATAARTGR